MNSLSHDSASRPGHRCGGRSLFVALALMLLAGEARAAGCPDGSVAIGSDCVQVSEAADHIGQWIRDAIDAEDLEAVIVSVKVGDVPVLTEAWGDSMTGVPATPDMHFHNGNVAVAYLATVLLQLQDRGVISLDDRLSKWFPDYPKSDQVTLRMLINCTSGYADYVSLETLPLYEDVLRQWTPDAPGWVDRTCQG